MSLHVIFGTGPVGRSVMQAALMRGHRVRIINRSGKGHFPQGVEHLAGDVLDPAFVKQAIAGAQVVYQALGAPYHRWPKLFPPMQQTILEAVSGTDILLISLENLYMYGDQASTPLSTDMAMKAHTRKGSVRAEMAQQLQAAHERGQIRSIQARAADFIGPQVLESSMISRYLKPLVQGKRISVMGNPALPHAFTYMPDIGRSLLTLAYAPEAEGKAWHLPCPEPISVREILTRMGKEVEQTPRLRSTPPWLLQVIGWFNPIVAELPEMLYQWEKPFLVDHSPIEKAFGLRATPWDEIIPATLSWWLQQSGQSIPA